MAKKQDKTEGTAFFDLGAYIAAVTSPDVAGQMASTYAFMVDVSIQKHARMILRTLTDGMRQHEGYESVKDIYSVLESHEFLEEQMAQAGLSQDGPLASLKRLIAMRPGVNDLAQQLVGMTFKFDGTARIFEVKDLVDIFEEKPDLKINARTAQRIKVSVERHGEGHSSEDISKVLEKRMQREQEKLNDTANAMFDQRRALAVICEYAERAQTEASFYELDAVTQRALITNVLNSAQRAEEFAASNSNLSDAEFDSISFCVLKVSRELKAVLQSPKFTIAAREMATV